MKVYIAQLLCPQRHCVLAATGEYESPEAAAQELGGKLGTTVGEWVQRGILLHECGICKSRDLMVEVKPTIFKTMAEARGPLAELERANRESARFLKGSRN